MLPPDQIPLCDKNEFRTSNFYLYRRQYPLNQFTDELDEGKIVFISHDLDGTGVGHNVLVTKKWYDEVTPEICENGVIASGTPGATLYTMAAQCHDRLFQLFKKHFHDEYVMIHAETLSLLTTDTIISISEEMCDIIKKDINDEPSGIPSMDEWETEVETFNIRMEEHREESIFDMETKF